MRTLGRRPRPSGFVARLAAILLATCVVLLAACAPRAATEGVEHRSASPLDVAGERPTANLSLGCRASDAPPLPERIVVAGRDRALLATPPRHAGAAPHDLVIAFHGRTNDAAQARGYFALNSAMPDALIVYPQALPAGPGTFAWSDPSDPIDAQRDFELVAAIVDTLGAARCIDLDRVFAVGHSLGAYFANDLACHSTGLVRAVASVAGGIRGEACASSTAALLLHHPDDHLVPISAGLDARDAFLAANGQTVGSAVAASRPALAALGCVRVGDDGVPHPVVWCAHDDATSASGRYDPHRWPNGTAAAAAAFFRDLP